MTRMQELSNSISSEEPDQQTPPHQPDSKPTSGDGDASDSEESREIL